jgi:hypothetical protein
MDSKLNTGIRSIVNLNKARQVTAAVISDGGRGKESRATMRAMHREICAVNESR